MKEKNLGKRELCCVKLAATVETLNIHCLVFLQMFLGLSNSTAIPLMQLAELA